MNEPRKPAHGPRGMSLTQAELEHRENIHALPCCICWKKFGALKYGVHAHHAGEGSERHNMALVPLCEEHHQGATGIHGLHRRPFHRMWKTTDILLLAWTNEALYKFGKLKIV